MLDPIVRTIEVPCGQEEAFRVFVAEMSSWWPLDTFTTSALAGSPAESVRVDARQGGKIVEIGPNGTEYEWGTIRTYEPHAWVCLDFHIPHPTVHSDARSLVDVQFTALSGSRTRVELTQSNWEAFGDLAEAVRGGYGSAWVRILEGSYLAACGGRPAG